MLTEQTSLLLLGILFVPLLGVLMWGLWAILSRRDADIPRGRGDGVMLALLAVAAFSLGVFVTFVVIGMAR